VVKYHGLARRYLIPSRFADAAAAERRYVGRTESVTTRDTRLRGRWLAVWVAGVLGLVLALVLAFRVGFRSPHLVAAGIPLNDGEMLLLTSPADQQPVWMVYGVDGTPRRRWGREPLPRGIVEDSDGRLRDPTAESEPFEQLETGMLRRAPGQTRFVSDVVGNRLVHFQDPPGILLERFRDNANHDHLLERVRLDGSIVWSASLEMLLGTVDFRPDIMELRHAHIRVNPQTMLVIVQACASFSARPVDAAVSRMVVIDTAAGRVIKRVDILRPPL
jgi:hypothetical protein